MNNKEILKEIREMSGQQRRQISYERLVQLFGQFSEDEILELSEIIGYPVFARLCMNELNHKFPLLQDGAAAVIVNEQGQILLQRRVDNDRWGLPGGCQELRERFEDTVIREVFEETGLVVKEEDLTLVAVVSGDSRKRQYPNGDIVYNNTVLYVIKNYTGELKCDEESKVQQFFDMENLPESQHDADLIRAYVQSLKS